MPCTPQLLVLLFGLLTSNVQTAFFDSGICPLSLPCHCIGDQEIYCAFKRLATMPEFLNFAFTWRVLNLSENFLKQIKRTNMNGVRTNVINFAHNIIDSIEKGAFSGTMDVETINLSHNYLTDIPAGIFELLPQLKTLHFKYNQLKTVNNKAFTNVPGLLELDLAGNDLVVVPSEALRPLKHLKRLILRNNKLKSLDSMAFFGLSLEYVDIGANIAPFKVYKDAFCGLEPKIVNVEPNVVEWKGLQTLRLDHNGIKTLDPCIAKMVWTIHTVDLSGNPLHCDCKIFMFRKIGPGTRFPGSQCASPILYAGRYVENVKANCSWIDNYISSCDQSCEEQVPQSLSSDGGASSSSSSPSFYLIFLASTFLHYNLFSNHGC